MLSRLLISRPFVGYRKDAEVTAEASEEEVDAAAGAGASAGLSVVEGGPVANDTRDMSSL